MFKFEIKYTDGSILCDESNGKYTLTVKESSGVFTPVFRPHVNDAIDQIVITLEKNEEFFTGMKLLSSGNCTNDIIEIWPYDDNTRFEPKECTVMKNAAGDTMFVGFVREHRFVSVINIDRRKITFTYEMENKAVNPEEDYELEPFFVKENGDVHEMLEEYASLVAEANDAVPAMDTHAGFCTWSYFYHNVDEKKMRRGADQTEKYGEGGATLFQIDDGWQEGGSFCGTWKIDEEKFPDMKGLSDYVRSKGMEFGIWVAPLIVSKERAGEPEVAGLLIEDVSTSNSCPLDFSKPEVYEYLKELFTGLKNNYNITYFKLDFLWSAIKDFSGKRRYFSFDGDYAMAYYRKALKTIRDAVGEDTYLLACGAPVLAGAGIMNGIRVSCDIVWGKIDNFPTYWELIKKTTASDLYRYFYNGVVFRIDADGLCLRGEDCGDGFEATYNEAKLWATTVAMSGGPVLVNEDLDKLPPERAELFTKLMYPVGVAAKPYDYFEDPCPSVSYATYGDNVSFVALYNWDYHRQRSIKFELSKIGMDGGYIIDSFSGTFLGARDMVETGVCNPHTAAMFVVVKPPKEPCFLYSDINVWGGINLFCSSYENGRLTVYGDSHGKNIYTFFPKGYAPEGEVVAETEEGVVCRYTE